MKNCHHCGAEMADEAAFCPNCGAAAEASSAGAGSQNQTNQAQYNQSQNNQNQNGQSQYSQNQYGQNQYGQNQYGQNQYNQNQYGQNQYNQNQYGQNPYSQNPYNQNAGNGSAQHAFSILTYFFGIIGWLIAYCAGDKFDPYLRFHLNQSLIIFLFSLLDFIPVVGWIWGVFMFVCWILSLIGACQHKTTEAPLLGKIHLLK